MNKQMNKQAETSRLLTIKAEVYLQVKAHLNLFFQQFVPHLRKKGISSTLKYICNKDLAKTSKYRKGQETESN